MSGIDQALARAAEHFTADRYAEAAAAFAEALELDPSRFEAHIGLAYCAVASDRAEEGIDRLVATARVSAQSGAVEAACALFATALELAPERLWLHVDVAELEAKRGSIAAAKKRLVRLAEAYEDEGLGDEARAVRDVIENLVAQARKPTPPPAPPGKLLRSKTGAPPTLAPRAVNFRDTAPLPIRSRDTARLTILQPATLLRAMRQQQPIEPIRRRDTAPLLVLQPTKGSRTVRRNHRKPSAPAMVAPQVPAERCAPTCDEVEHQSFAAPPLPWEVRPESNASSSLTPSPFAALEAPRASVLETAVKIVTDSSGRQRIAVLPAPGPVEAAPVALPEIGAPLLMPNTDSLELTRVQDDETGTIWPPPRHTRRRHTTPALPVESTFVPRSPGAEFVPRSTGAELVSSMPKSPLTQRLRERATGLPAIAGTLGTTASVDDDRAAPGDGDVGAV